MTGTNLLTLSVKGDILDTSPGGNVPRLEVRLGKLPGWEYDTTWIDRQGNITLVLTKKKGHFKGDDGCHLMREIFNDSSLWSPIEKSVYKWILTLLRKLEKIDVPNLDQKTKQEIVRLNHADRQRSKQ